jgi:hypothetical protein
MLTSMMWRRWVLHLISLLMTCNFICPVDMRIQWCARNKCIVHLQWCMTICLPIVLDSTRPSLSLYGSVQHVHVVGLTKMSLHQHPLVDSPVMWKGILGCFLMVGLRWLIMCHISQGQVTTSSDRYEFYGGLCH